MATISNSNDSNAVEDRMALLRAKLRRDAESCQQARERWTDWRNHVMAHRWLVCGLAAAVGYALVPGPRRKGEVASFQPPMPAVPSLKAGQGLVARIATEIGRRAAQQALAAGTAWALTRFREAQLSASTSNHQSEYEESLSPDTEYAP